MKIVKNRVIGASGPYTFFYMKPGEIIEVNDPRALHFVLAQDGMAFYMNDEDRRIYVHPRDVQVQWVEDTLQPRGEDT